MLSGVTQGHWQCHHSIEHTTTSYSSVTETMHLSSTVLRYSKLFVEIRRLYATPSASGTRWGDPIRISPRCLAPENCWAIVQCHLRHSTFSHCSRTPTCDRHRQSDTDRHSSVAYTAQSIAHAVIIQHHKSKILVFAILSQPFKCFQNC